MSLLAPGSGGVGHLRAGGGPVSAFRLSLAHLGAASAARVAAEPGWEVLVAPGA